MREKVHWLMKVVKETGLPRKGSRRPRRDLTTEVPGSVSEMEPRNEVLGPYAKRESII